MVSGLASNGMIRVEDDIMAQYEESSTLKRSELIAQNETSGA